MVLIDLLRSIYPQCWIHIAVFLPPPVLMPPPHSIFIRAAHPTLPHVVDSHTWSNRNTLHTLFLGVWRAVCAIAGRGDTVSVTHCTQYYIPCYIESFIFPAKIHLCIRAE